MGMLLQGKTEMEAVGNPMSREKANNAFGVTFGIHH